MTVLAPHASEVREAWEDRGVETVTFRYAPESFEVLGYGRSLNADEAVRWRAGLVAPFYALAASRAVRRLVRQRAFDLVHAHWIVPNGVVLASMSLATPFAIGLHGSDVFLAERRGVRSLVAASLRRTRLLTGCSPELVERICRLGYDSSRAHVIPYGVDTELFCPDAGRRSIWRQRLDIGGDDLVVLTIGRMVTKKGFPFLLEVIPSLLEEFSRAHFVFGGEGDRLAEFRQRVATWEGRVHFPGEVLRDTLPDLYRTADVFVLPAVHDPKGNVDGLPNVILEAMASGLPVVASAISGVPLAVTNGQEGLLVPEKDSVALGEALRRLMTDRDLRLELGEAARGKAVRELTWTAVAARYRQAYQECLAR